MVRPTTAERLQKPDVGISLSVLPRRVRRNPLCLSMSADRSLTAQGSLRHEWLLTRSCTQVAGHHRVEAMFLGVTSAQAAAAGRTRTMACLIKDTVVRILHRANQVRGLRCWRPFADPRAVLFLLRFHVAGVCLNRILGSEYGADCRSAT